jgi:outer membrane protein TolC
VDQNVQLQQADAAVRTLRAQLAEAQQNLRVLQDQLARLDQQLRESDVILDIQRAEIHANLDALLRGEAVLWNVQGTFLDAPFALEETLNFGDPHTATAQLFGALLRR